MKLLRILKTGTYSIRIKKEGNVISAGQYTFSYKIFVKFPIINVLDVGRLFFLSVKTMLQGSVETGSFKKHPQLLCNGKIKKVATGTFGSQISEAGSVRTNVTSHAKTFRMVAVQTLNGMASERVTNG